MSAADQTLRQRKKPSTESSIGETTEKYAESLSTMAPSQIKPYLIQAIPYVRMTAEFIESTIPLLEVARNFLVETWVKMKPYKPELLFPAFAGFILCFFGGSFFTLIAAVEAYRMCSHDQIDKCVKDLITDFNAFCVANKDDDKVDADKDGIADVKEISGKELATRKTILFLKTVDPKRVTDALAGLNTGLFAIVATLKLEFIKSITLGNSISTIVEPHAKKFIVPSLKIALTKDYEKWAEPVVTYTVKSVAVSIAWFIQRVVSAFHSAIRGSHMFANNILEYLTIMGYLQKTQREAMLLDTIIAPVLALIGLWFQFSQGFSLRFPLNILLFPFSMCEWFLMWAVSS